MSRFWDSTPVVGVAVILAVLGFIGGVGAIAALGGWLLYGDPVCGFSQCVHVVL